MLFSQLASVFALNDQLITSFTSGSCFLTFCIFTCSGTWVTTGSPSFTTTHRVINRVHGHTSGAWSDPSPSVSTCLTHALQVMIAVRSHTNCSITIDQYLS